jgi:hypothetical protein
MVHPLKFHVEQGGAFSVGDRDCIAGGKTGVGIMQIKITQSAAGQNHRGGRMELDLTAIEVQRRYTRSSSLPALDGKQKTIA